ncbi:peptidylprolyl isomerase [Thermodesulfobacteriota bacterium]
MGQVKNGNTVKIHFTGKLENGEVFDTSLEREPMEFQVGNGDVMQGLEEGIVGMALGDTKTIEIRPEQGFGARHEDLVVEVVKTLLPESVTPEVGQQLQVSKAEGETIVVTIIDMDDDTVTLDANHPLAGHTLIFDVELVEVQ